MTDLHNDELQETRFAASSSDNTDDSASVDDTRRATVLYQGPCQSRQSFLSRRVLSAWLLYLSLENISGRMTFLSMDALASNCK